MKRFYREPAEEEYMTDMYKKTDRAVISFLPLRSEENRFAALFSQAVAEQGYRVHSFRWRSLGLMRTKLVFLHWPDEFFGSKGKSETFKSLVKLAVIQIARLLWNAKFIWIAHNATPHGVPNSKSLLRHWFLRSLSGIIFLSNYSRRVIGGLYPETKTCKTLVTVHGHYRGAAVTRETPSTTPSGDIKLVHFGQIRPYKNVEVLVDVVSSISTSVHLVVAGFATDRSLCSAIQLRARAVPHIKLDFRDAPIGDAELEAIVDSADAVVLPYKNILNSGSALFALSRNRPVLAPNIGSLPELRDTVGQDWIYLYDGEFTEQVFSDFREWMFGTKRARTAPLDAYDFSRIGQELRKFIDAM